MLFKVVPDVQRMVEGILWAGKQRLGHSKRQKALHFSRTSHKEGQQFAVASQGLMLLMPSYRWYRYLRRSWPGLDPVC